MMTLSLRILAFFFVSVTLSVQQTPVHAQDWSAIRAKVPGAVIFVEVVREKRDGSNRQVLAGTGFVFDDRGYAITAAHVVPRVADDERLSVKIALRSRYAPKTEAQVVLRVDDLDLALLQFPDIGKKWPTASFGASSKVPTDARLYVLGFPGSSDLASAEGLLSSYYGPGGKWQTTLPLDYGHSGGPVFDISGRVVGIAAGGFDQAKARTFVVPSDYSKMLRYVVAGLSPIEQGKKPTTLVAFAHTSFENESELVARTVCLSKAVASVIPEVISTNGAESDFVSTAIDPSNPKCFDYKVRVDAGKIDLVGPIIVGYEEPSWIAGKFKIEYKATKK
jgi:hypothetical protein